MIIPTKNYKQEKTEGEDYQTVILDQELTGETDELNLAYTDPIEDEDDDSNEDDEDFPTEEDLDSDNFIDDEEDDLNFDDEY